MSTITDTDLISAVSALVGDDGTGDLGVAVSHAPPGATAREIADVILAARAEWRAEVETQDPLTGDTSDYDA